MCLRYLHISDLHLTRQAKGKAGVEKSDQDMVTESMLEKIKKLTQEEKKTFDLIFITGDLAYGGKPDDYEVVKRFCEGLLKVTGVPRQRLFLVPGNHDVDRSQVKPSHKDRLYKFDKEEQIKEVLGDEDLFPLLMRKFDAFNHFAEQAMGRTLYSQTKYYFTEFVSLPTAEETVLNVVGLNSALFAGYDGDDKQKLALGLPQVDGALSDLKNNALLTIVLFHHPFDCSHPDDKKWCSKRILKDADLILTGHLHEPENMWIHNGVAEAVLISAGASFEKRNSEENSFNVGEIDLTTGSGKVQFYKYLPTLDQWKENTDANPSDKDGIFHFEIKHIKPGSPPAEVILAVEREIKECIRRVELIANCKQIHDCLHEVLQNVIRRLREEVLSKWKQEGKLSRSNVIIGCVNKAAEQRGTIKGVGKSIGPEHGALRNGVDIVLDKVQRCMDWINDLDWDEVLLSARSWEGIGDRLAEHVDDLASYVEFTFNEADISMTKEESALRERYLRLREGLEQAREHRNLSPLDHQRLDDELEKVESNRELLRNALTTHHSWQEAHNVLHQLDLSREKKDEKKGEFENALNVYLNTDLSKLLALVDGELGQAHAYQAGIAESEQGGGAIVVRQAPPSLSPGSPDACGASRSPLKSYARAMTCAFSMIYASFSRMPSIALTRGPSKTLTLLRGAFSPSSNGSTGSPRDDGSKNETPAA